MSIMTVVDVSLILFCYINPIWFNFIASFGVLNGTTNEVICTIDV